MLPSSLFRGHDVLLMSLEIPVDDGDPRVAAGFRGRDVHDLESRAGAGACRNLQVRELLASAPRDHAQPRGSADIGGNGAAAADEPDWKACGRRFVALGPRRS